MSMATHMTALLIVVPCIATSPARGDDFCRDMWAKMTPGQREDFAAAADDKVLAKAPPESRAPLKACFAANRSTLIARLDTECAGGTGSPDAITAVIDDHGRYCVMSVRLSELEGTIAALEKRLDAIEKGGSSTRKSSSTIPTAEAGGWHSKANWRSLRRSMTPAQVRNLLGEPDRVESIIVLTYWYYGDSEPRPYVSFDSASMRVNGWGEPQ